MIQIIQKEDRHFSDYGWLQTYWLFSFSDYIDPNNMHFGALRVFNDDVVAPGTGFSLHPHEEKEIVTIVLDGELTHEDNMHNTATTHTNEVQCMSAGTGIIHAEYNHGDRPVHLYQIWIYPAEAGLTPSYNQRAYDPSQWRNVLFPVASGQGFIDAATIHADATIYRSELEQGRSLNFTAEAGRRIFVYLSRGTLTINGQQVNELEQARIIPEGLLHIDALQDAGFILIDVPS